MDIFLMFVVVIAVIYLLIKISEKLDRLNKTCDKIEEIAVMTEKEKDEYSLRIDNPDKYQDYISDNYWQDEAKRKKKNRKILDLIKRQPKLTLDEIAERYGESELSLKVIIDKENKGK